MRNVDAIQSVLEIGGPHTDGIDGKRDAGPTAQRACDECGGTGEFAQPGDENHLRRERHPIRRNLEKLSGRGEMRHAARDKERREEPAHDCAGGGEGNLGVVAFRGSVHAVL